MLVQNNYKLVMLNKIIEDFQSLKEAKQQAQGNIRDVIGRLKNDISKIKEYIQPEVRTDELNLKESKDANIDKVIGTITKVEDDLLLKRFNNTSNDYYSNLGRFGKTMSNSFDGSDSSSVINFQFDNVSFLNLLTKELYRRGNLKTAESLIEESKIDFNSSFQYLFSELNSITQDLKKGILDSLLCWTVKYDAQLSEFKSEIKFKIAVVQVVNALHSNGLRRLEVVNESKRFLKGFCDNKKYFCEISKLFTYISIFDKLKLRSCPAYINYSEYDYDTLISGLVDQFTEDCCSIMSRLNY